MNLIEILDSKFDDTDDLNVKEMWQNEDPDELNEFDDGLNEFQDEDEEIGKVKSPHLPSHKNLENQIKILGSNFVDFDDFNAEDIWQNEDSEELDEFDDGLYGLQDEDEEKGKMKTTTNKFIKTLANLI